MVKTLGQVGGILAVRPAPRGRVADAGSAGPTSTSGRIARQADGRRGPAHPSSSADPKRQALHRPGMVGEPVLRFPQAGLSAHRPTGPNDLVEDADGLDPHTRQKAEFYIKQIANAIVAVEFRADQSGTAARDAVAPMRENLVRGMHMLAEDIEAGGATSRSGRSDATKFEVGRNLAITPGKVDFPERADAAHPVRADRPRRC